MKTIVPYTKEIVFKTKIAEIISMSLEHEINIKEEEILGDFVISGEYRSHEVSINKEKFLYRLPISVDLTEKIDKDSLCFEIEDFYYDVVGDDTLKINIEFSVSAEEIKEETPVITDILPEIETVDEVISEPTELLAREETLEDRIDTETTIMTKTSEFEDTYITYNIHIVRENETLDSLCSMYATNIDILKQYNVFEELNLGDKILIPELSNE